MVFVCLRYPEEIGGQPKQYHGSVENPHLMMLQRTTSLPGWMQVEDADCEQLVESNPRTLTGVA